MKLHNYRNLYLTAPITPKRAEEFNLRSIMGEDSIKYYKYRFPVCYWEKNDGSRMPTLFCTFTIDTFDWHINVDVTTLEDTYYADFYCAVITHKNKDQYPMLCNIHEIIQKELQKFGVTQRKEVKDEVQNNDKNKSKTDRRSDKGLGSTGKRVLRERKCKADTTNRTRVPREDVHKRDRRKKSIPENPVSPK